MYKLFILSTNPNPTPEKEKMLQVTKVAALSTPDASLVKLVPLVDHLAE